MDAGLDPTANSWEEMNTREDIDEKHVDVDGLIAREMTTGSPFMLLLMSDEVYMMISRASVALDTLDIGDSVRVGPEGEIAPERFTVIGILPMPTSAEDKAFKDLRHICHAFSHYDGWTGYFSTRRKFRKFRIINDMGMTEFKRPSCRVSAQVWDNAVRMILDLNDVGFMVPPELAFFMCQTHTSEASCGVTSTLALRGDAVLKLHYIERHLSASLSPARRTLVMSTVLSRECMATYVQTHLHWAPMHISGNFNQASISDNRGHAAEFFEAIVGVMAVLCVETRGTVRPAMTEFLSRYFEVTAAETGVGL
jgi:hypothetical protein